METTGYWGNLHQIYMYCRMIVEITRRRSFTARNHYNRIKLHDVEYHHIRANTLPAAPRDSMRFFKSSILNRNLPKILSLLELLSTEKRYDV